MTASLCRWLSFALVTLALAVPAVARQDAGPGTPAAGLYDSPLQVPRTPDPALEGAPVEAKPPRTEPVQVPVPAPPSGPPSAADKGTDTGDGQATAPESRPLQRRAKEPTRRPPPKEAAPAPEALEDEDGPQPEAGEAEEPDEEAQEQDPPPGHAALYHEQPSPLVFRRPARGRSPEARAKAATAALTDALDESSDDKELPEAQVVIEDGRALVRVGEHIVTTLYPEDASAEGMTLERYAAHIETRLDTFIPAQLRRKAFQLFFLHAFLSVLFGVIGFLTLRGLKNAFNRWDEELDERRGSFKPISVLRIPVFSGEALASGLAFGLAVGRVTAYVATVIATAVAVLSQFEFTRPLLRRIVSWGAGPVLNAVEAVVTAVPGLILAAGLVVAVRAALRVLNVLLDGVASKRLKWQRLPPERVPVFRFGATVAAVVVIAPLLVAAVFGRWGTPLETLALSGGLAVIVAAIPLLASYIIGVFTLWRDIVRPGDWVQVGSVSGEVTRLSVAEVHLVPETGGTIAVPMIYLLFHPLRRLRTSPEVSFEVTVARDRPAKELIAALKKAVVVVESDARVELVDLCRAWIKARISAPAVREGVRQSLMMAVADAVDRHEFELPTLHGPDR